MAAGLEAVVACANGDLLEVVGSAADGHGIDVESSADAAEVAGGVGKGDGRADGRRGALEIAAHLGDRLLSVVGNGHMVAVFVDHDNFV
jgi:hypothetical protein